MDQFKHNSKDMPATSPTDSTSHRWRIKPKIIAIVAVIGVIVVVAISLRQSGDRLPAIDDQLAAFRLPKPPPPDMGYVGSEMCATCHAEIAEQFVSHPMGMATNTVAAASVVEDYEKTQFAPPGPRRYRIEKTDEGVFHHEVLLDVDGKPIYDQAEQIHYAVGSGQHARTYLINGGGAFFESPITWYSQRQRWDLSPGYHPVKHLRFSRRITENCLQCHAGRVLSERPSSVRFRDPPFVEMAISCERCHGPGKRHVELNATQATAEGIVNPAKLEPFERESVCYRCHLKHVAMFPRYGRTFDDFRPGERLDDSLLVFVEAANAQSKEKLKVTSQVAQMRSSNCFVGSQGELGCISCHDPHYKPPESEQDEFYRHRCFRCHEQHEESCALPLAKQRNLPAAGSCIHCHMPASPLSDIPHTAHTDHRISRQPDSRSTTAFQVRQDDSVVLFGHAEQRVPQRELRRGYGLLFLTAATMTNDKSFLDRARLMLLPPGHGDAGKLDAALDAIGDDVRVLTALAQIHSAQNHPKEAMACWERVLKREPENEQMLDGITRLYGQSGDMPRALDYQDRLLKINPYSDVFHERRAQYLDKLDDLTAATEAAEKALQINPANERVREWLADAYQRAGMEEESAAHRETLNRIRETFRASRRRNER